MICARTLTTRSLSIAAVATSIPSTKSRHFLTLSSLPLRHSFPRQTTLSSCTSSSSCSKIRMSSSTTTTTTPSSQIIEHIVLFKVKQDTDPTKVTAMVNGLSSLRNLDTLLHLTIGPIHRIHSPPPLTFTHMLHTRYRTKEDLATYSAHPDHQGVVKETVLPICEDIMAVDWVSQPDLGGPVSPHPGSAMRVQMMKVKEGKSGEVVLGVIGGLKDKIDGMDQISFGENFSPGRAKGYGICSIGVFGGGVCELVKVEGSEEIEKEKGKVRDLIDGLIVIDYVLPNPQSAASSL